MLGGQEAKAAVETVMAKGTLSCAWNGDMTYDRKVGRCTAEIEEQRYDIGSLLIVSGVCGRCPRFDTDGFYLEAQSIGGYKGPFPQYCHG